MIQGTYIWLLVKGVIFTTYDIMNIPLIITDIIYIYVDFESYKPNIPEIFPNEYEDQNWIHIILMYKCNVHYKF